jgi:tetratricopeptide (TPR) repeat protein
MAKRKTKKTQPGKQKGWMAPKKQVHSWLTQATRQVLEQAYPRVVQTCQRIVRYAPANSPERAEALEHLATAYTMLKQFEEAYQALSQALEINSQHAYLWYNRGLVGRYTMRLVQALHDFEKAIELEKDPDQREKFIEILAETRQMAEGERALRGVDFTLEQLGEQQELFSQGLQLMRREEWAEAEQIFRQVIEMGEDCLPQPHGNLGLVLLMQKKHDEAEVALQRALEIDPNYELAQRNLAALPSIRQSGQTPAFLMTNPMTKAKIGLTVQIVDD